MSETAKFLTPEQAARVDHSRFDAEKIDRPTITYWQGAWRRLKKNPLAVVAMVMLAVVLFFVLLGPTISGQEYIKINASIKNTAPNSANWFGTDTMGRDIFCRVWIGARLSLIVALVCSTIQIVVGCAYGGAMAYFGGTVDSVMMRVIEVITSFPSLLITLLIMMVVGQNVGGLLFAMCITSWCGTARQMRGHQAPAAQHRQHPDPEPLLQHPQLYLYRGQPELPRHGPVQRCHQPGRPHQPGQGQDGFLPLAAVLPGGSALHCGAGVQPAGRWSARRAGPPHH